MTTNDGNDGNHGNDGNQGRDGGIGGARPDPAAFATPADWAAGLTALRHKAGLSVRDLARAAGASASTVGGYVAGRHLPTPAATDAVRRLLAACGLDEAGQGPWLEALVRLRRAPVTRAPEAAAPYKGLAGYDVADAAWFCGREALTALLVRRAQAGPDRPLLLVGASGSGKSSILRAGLAATLAGQGWALVVTTPGTDPDGAARAAADRAGEVAGRPVLVVVDQLEELWTTGAPDAAWRAAVQHLAALAARPGVVVAAAVRADFYARALASAPLAAALQQTQVVVGPMTRDELVRAVTGPAERAGVPLEPGLVDLVLADLAPRGVRPDGDAYEPGALPLLSFALLATWQRQQGRLTVAGYTGSGGITGAVAAAAEAVHDGLDARERALARRLFTRLVAVGEETGDTRRRVGHDELDALEPPDPGPGPGVADVVERFVAARLLTAGAEHVEITHEALLVAWPRLRGWIDEDRAGLVVQRALADAARAWQRTGHDPDGLLRGARLEAVLDWTARADRPGTLTADERRFVEESARAAADRRQRARRRTRRLQALSVGLAALLLAVAGLAGYAQDVRRDAETERDLTRSRQLAEAANRLRPVDPVVAARFALLAYRTAPTVEARSALLDTAAVPLARRLDGPGGIASVAVSADGRTMAAVGAGGGLRLWALPDGDPAATVPRRLATVPDAGGDAPQPELYAVAVDATGGRVLTGGLGGGVRVWSTADPAAPRLQATLGTDGLTVYGLALGRDDVVAAALAGNDPGGADRQVGRVGLWRLTGGGAEPLGAPLDVGDTVTAVAFDATGGTLAVGTGGGTVHRFTVAAAGATRAGPVLAGPTSDVTALAFAPDGRTLAAGSRDLLTHVWALPDATGAPVPPPDAEPGRTARTLAGAQSWVNTVSFSPDGATLAAGSSDSRLRVYDTGAYALVADVGNPGPVTATVHTADGRLMVTAGADGAVRLTPLPLPVAALPGGRTFALAYLDDRHVVGANATAARVLDVGTPFAAAPVTAAVGPPAGSAERFAGTLAVPRGGRLVASGGRAGTTWLYDWTGTGLVMRSAATGQQRRLVQSAVFTAAGRHLVTGSDDATLAVWDVTDPARPVAARPAVEAGGIVYALATSPDGRLLAAGTGTAGAVRLWDVSDPARLRLVGEAPPGPALQVYGLSFSADSRTLAVGSADRTIRLLDVSAPAAPRWAGPAVTGPGDYVFSLQLSRDGRRLAAAAGDGVVRVYDVGAQGGLAPYAVLAAAGRVALYSVAVAPDGGQLSAAGAPEAVLTWTLDPEAAARRVCGLAGDPVTPQEWAGYLPSVAFADPCPP